MPPTFEASTPYLWITLEGHNGDQPYAPGETIRGYVNRAAPSVTPEACIDISLHGRTKAKMTVQTAANSQAYFRSRFRLIDEAANARRLFKGPLHIPEGGQPLAWPFAVTIPTHVNPKTVCYEPRQLEPFISITPADVSKHALPPTMGAREAEAGTHTTGFVEYYLKADISMIVGGRKVVNDAFLPVLMAPVLPEPPITDFKVKQNVEHCDVQTQLLLPGRQGGKLSIKEKFKKSMGTPSVPTLALKVLVTVPAVLQLGNPLPVPFKVQLAPDWEKSSDKIRNEVPKIKLTWAELVVSTKTFVRCDGTLLSKKDDDTRMETDLEVWNKYTALGKEVDLVQGGSWPAVDLGALVDLRLSPASTPSIVKLYRELYPTYSTYNIELKHTLVWKVRFDVAGDPVTVAGKEPITVLSAGNDGSRFFGGGYNSNGDYVFGPGNEQGRGLASLGGVAAVAGAVGVAGILARAEGEGEDVPPSFAEDDMLGGADF